MILSDTTIEELIDARKITIFPDFDKKNIRPAGIRLHLGAEILIPEPGQTTDLEGSNDLEYRKIELDEKGYILKPNEFILGSTHEKFQVPRDILCHIDGRSTVARLGLSIHCTSTTIDGNFDEPRTVVLEMKNIGSFNIVLKPKSAIAMLTFSELSAPIQQMSQQQYKGQSGVVAPNMKIQKK